MKHLMALFLVVLAGMTWGIQPAFSDVSSDRLSEINQLWQGSAHALAEVNCSSCHQNPKTKAFVAQPDRESCRTCHEATVETFLLGKHGIRLQEGLTALTPGIARLPMKEAAIDKQMNCNSCHNVHSVNTIEASVNSCLSCHNDPHSLNYQNSQHARLFAADVSLPRPSSESVSCATCHLPRYRVGERVLVNHNNTYALLPRDRLVKDVCMNCHGLEFAYNSIFDDELVEANFDRPPTQELQTLEMIRQLQQKLQNPRSLK